MRPDQIKRLTELSEDLADVFIGEATPSAWPGADKDAATWTQQERGDRYWHKKNAMGTGGVLRHTLDLIASVDAAPAGTAPDDDFELSIKAAERRAAAAVERVLSKASGKAAFDRRVHGKPA
jgi:hypothetical protein